MFIIVVVVKKITAPPSKQALLLPTPCSSVLPGGNSYSNAATSQAPWEISGVLNASSKQHGLNNSCWLDCARQQRPECTATDRQVAFCNAESDRQTD
jgi:hypothetical protein